MGTMRSLREGALEDIERYNKSGIEGKSANYSPRDVTIAWKLYVAAYKDVLKTVADDATYYNQLEDEVVNLTQNLANMFIYWTDYIQSEDDEDITDFWIDKVQHMNKQDVIEDWNTYNIIASQKTQEAKLLKRLFNEYAKAPWATMKDPKGFIDSAAAGDLEECRYMLSRVID